MAVRNVSFAEFLFHGAMFSESSVQRVDVRDAREVVWPKSAYAVKFFDRVRVSVQDPVSGEMIELSSDERRVSRLTYRHGEVCDIEAIRELYPDSILLTNMEVNKWDKVVRVNGQFFPLNDGDSIL